MPQIDMTKTLKALTDERVNLLHQLAELGADRDGEFTGGMDFGDAFADAGAATAERTETMGIVRNLKTHLDDIEAAIARINDGTYGVCSVCGKTIGDDRMAYRPTSGMCVDCKTKSGS